jgi:hypothetical protein
VGCPRWVVKVALPDGVTAEEVDAVVGALAFLQPRAILDGGTVRLRLEVLAPDEGVASTYGAQRVATELGKVLEVPR